MPSTGSFVTSCVLTVSTTCPPLSTVMRSEIRGRSLRKGDGNVHAGAA